jgi:hypothetical protein
MGGGVSSRGGGQLEGRARRAICAFEGFWIWREIRSIEFLMEGSDGQERTDAV